MNREDYEIQAAEPTPDPRVVAVMRVVDLEQQHKHAARDAEERIKMAKIVQQELLQARDELSSLLGYPVARDAAEDERAEKEAIRRELEKRRAR